MTGNTVRGVLRKMHAALTDDTDTDANKPVAYQLPVGDELLPMNRHLGKPLSITFTGNIFCIACRRKINKSYNQGYCYPCFTTLAECDLCIVRPHTCHHHLGTCRDEAWAAGHCMQRHTVYLANSSGLKVGITRSVPGRWIDQGASQALAIFHTPTRRDAGLIENELAKHLSDRTDWRKMLTKDPARLDMRAEAGRVLAHAEPGLAALQTASGNPAWRRLDKQPINFTYPIRRYPDKARPLNLDKTPAVTGELWGIKGQYLIFDCGVLNIRKFAGYEVAVA